MELHPWQKETLPKLDSGRVLYGGVGSGKGFTALAYYITSEAFRFGRDCPVRLVIITTARKRDSGDWIAEALKMGISEDPNISNYGTVTVDSWNNITAYIDCKDCFFIFDEQRVVGSGAWVKSFLKIAKKNRWILLSGTPGDTWMDYAPVFVANGFYKSLSDFKHKHVKYKPFIKYPVIEGYYHEQKLEFLRNHILVEMAFPRHTKRYLNWVDVEHDATKLNRIWKDRWNIFAEEPVKDIAEMWRLMRRVVNMDPSRLETVRKLMRSHPRLIIFYNFDYELDILRRLEDEIEVHEYNGHHHDPVPTSDRWVYLVQYTSGAEAWNCVETNAMVFYSLTYSWKNFEQCQGRIDRLNTDYIDLYYYIFVSNSPICRAIRRALEAKKHFNERNEARKIAKEEDFIVEGWGDFG